jgi:hypothetical protein
MSQTSKLLLLTFPSIEACHSSLFLSFCCIFCYGTTYFEWINDTYEFSVYDIGFAYPLIEADYSSIVSFVCGICGYVTTIGIQFYT